MMQINRKLWFIGSAALALFMMWSTANAVDPTTVVSITPPEYRFVVGQELVYRESGEKVDSDRPGSFIETAVWQFFVLEQTSDDSWKLMVRRRRRFKRVEKDVDAAMTKLTAELDDPDDQKTMRSFAVLDIDKHGRIDGLSRRDGIFIPVTRLLVRLPSTNAEAQQGWNYEDLSRDENIASRLSAASSPEDVIIESVPRSLENDIYRVDEKIAATIDRTRGVLRKVQVNSTQSYNGKNTQTSSLKTELMDVKTHDAQWSQVCAKEAANCHALMHEYDAIWNSRDFTAEEIERQLTERIQRFTTVVESLQTIELQTAMREVLTIWKRELKYPIADAKERLERIGKPSPDWKTTDITGRDVALKDFKGKVVILDFWYRGCGWCIIAMPQGKKIAEHFKDQPVAFLNMNHNDELSDIQLVVDKAKLVTPVLKAGSIAEQYKIEGFPVLLILDQEGVIRDRHDGYSPTLAKDVIQSVESLLKAKP